VAWLVYDHDEGVGTFTYENEGEPVRHHEVLQPTQPDHLGWDSKKVLAARPREEMVRDHNFVYKTGYRE
jgi:hypothetical protein